MFKKNKLALVISSAFLVFGASNVQAMLLNFDDALIQAFRPLYAGKINYGGLSWGFGQEDWVIDSFYYSSSSSSFFQGGYVGYFTGQTAYSGMNFIWSNGANDLSLSKNDNSIFDLDGMQARFGNFTSGFATAHGFLNGTEIFTKVLSLTDTYQYQALNFTRIDKFTLTNQSNNVLIDDMSINLTPTIISTIPEPNSISLLGIGSALCFATSRLKKGKVASDNPTPKIIRFS